MTGGERQGRCGPESRAPWRTPRCQQSREQPAGLKPDFAGAAKPEGLRPGGAVASPDPGPWRGRGEALVARLVSLALGLFPAGWFQAFVRDSLRSSVWSVHSRPAEAPVRISGRLACLSII